MPGGSRNCQKPLPSARRDIAELPLKPFKHNPNFVLSRILSSRIPTYRSDHKLYTLASSDIHRRQLSDMPNLPNSPSCLKSGTARSDGYVIGRETGLWAVPNFDPVLVSNNRRVLERRKPNHFPVEGATFPSRMVPSHS